MLHLLYIDPVKVNASSQGEGSSRVAEQAVLSRHPGDGSSNTTVYMTEGEMNRCNDSSKMPVTGKGI